MNILHSLAQGVSAQKFSTPAVESGDRSKEASADKPKSDSSITDTVSISQDAIRMAEKAALSAKASYWLDFYPGREGFSTTNLAAAVVDPGAQPFSQNRSFAEVAQAARESMDSRYEAMRESGKPFRWNSAEGEPRGTFGGLDINAVFGELDRRALYAVASNDGGLFTKKEQQAAAGIMSQQQGNAMGFRSGPTSAAKNHVDPFMGNTEERFKAMNRFLDRVSIEERTTSIEWAQQRASGQRNVENYARERGETPEPFSTENMLLRIMLEAYDAQRARIEENGPDGDFISSMMEGYEERIAQAIEENRNSLSVS
ncbi:MAG: hypothetical protein AAFX09_01940 [Pseudomonadota bacterium]